MIVSQDNVKAAEFLSKGIIVDTDRHESENYTFVI